MKKLLFLILPFIILSCNKNVNLLSDSQNQKKIHPVLNLSPPEAKDRYTALVDSAIKDPDNTDFLAMRMAFTRTDDYSPYEESEHIDKIKKLLEEEKYMVATEVIKTVYYKVFHKPIFHYYAFIAWENTGKKDVAKVHSIYYDKLISSITSTGDGKSVSSPWYVINISEEYRVIEYLEMEMISQSLVTKRGNNYDLMKVKDKDGKKKEIYFNIDLPFSKLNE